MCNDVFDLGNMSDIIVMSVISTGLGHKHKKVLQTVQVEKVSKPLDE